jgi:8-oxo-dGTP pyrophosphatase MutT (NUDIX family)
VFGGGIEPGEKPEEAGAREFVEEAGYRLNKPRMLPYGPVTRDWVPPYDSPQQAEKAKKYKGSRTFFGTGEVGDAVPMEERGSDTMSQLQKIRFRSLQTALRHTIAKRGLNPEATLQRRAVLRHLLSERQRSVATSQH